MKARLFAILSLSLILLAAVPATVSEGATDVRVEFYKHYGDAEPIWFYETDSPVTKIAMFPSLPAGADHWELNGKKLAGEAVLDEPCYANPVKIYAVYASTDPDPTPSFGGNGGSMLYLGLGMVIIIAMLAYIIVVRMDLAKVCRKK